MNNRIKTYIFLGTIVGTAVLSYNMAESGLNSLYEPDTHFAEGKAKMIKNTHKVVAGLIALNNTVVATNILGKILYKAK